MTACSIKGLSVLYGQITALKNINLEIPAGEIYGIIGPDGAGKTTLMRSICTLLPYQKGSIEVLGLNTEASQKEIRASLGYMPQRFSLYQDLSVQQNLAFFAQLFGVKAKEYHKRLAELYRFSRLEPFRTRRAGNLSGGMKQKLALSCALIHTPRLIVLDEPTFGVDPVSRIEFWNILHELQADGVSIIVSTPYMEEAEQCDSVALIHKGVVMETGNPAGLIQKWPFKLYSISGIDLPTIKTFLQQQPETFSIQLFGSEIHLSSKQVISPEIISQWQQLCPEIDTCKAIEPGMEDVFLEMMHRDRA